ncbi:MAG: Slp family lipoprotein [Dokdonella sp.]
MKKPFAIVLFSVALASCASIPTPLQGQFSTAMPRDAGSAANGEAVRWGGEIIKVEPKADATCFEILARELDASARPTSRDDNGGRFIACRSGFHDPETFAHGRDVTVIGHVTGTDHGKVGEFDYAYPHVTADAVYLWPERPLYPRSPYYDPWMWGYGAYGFGAGPFWGGPYWGGGTIIIRDHHHHGAPRPGH